MYTALIDPPYELPPKYMPAVVALQLELFTLLMDTFTPLAVVTADSLLLVFVPEVQAYPPRYTENDPPYTCAKTLHQRASHAQRQYDRGGNDRKSTDIGAVRTRSFCGMNTSQRRENEHMRAASKRTTGSGRVGERRAADGDHKAGNDGCAAN